MRTDPLLSHSYGPLSEVDRHYCVYLALTWELKENKERREGQKLLLKLVLNELKLISKGRLTDLQPPSLKQTQAFRNQRHILTTRKREKFPSDDLHFS